MPAVITNTPVQIGTNPEFRQSLTEINPFLFLVGTNLYQVLVGYHPLLLSEIAIFKSTDNGATWTKMDSANSPDQGSQTNVCQALYNSTTNTIAVIYILTGNVTLKLCEFSTATDTWGSPTSALSVSAFTTTWAFCQQSGGDYVLIGGTNLHLYYVVNSAGTWGSITNLTAAGATVYGGVIDATDTIHFLTNETGFNLSYRQLSVAFAVSAATTVAANFALSTVPSIKLHGADSLGLGYIRTTGNSAIRSAIGTPLSAPVFTEIVVFTTSDPNLNLTYPVVEEGNSSTLNMFFIETDVNSNPLVDQMMQSTYDDNSATWSTPIVFYDAVADPPPNGPTDPLNQFLHTIDAVQLADDTWAVATTMETGTSGEFCTGFALVPTAPAPGCPDVWVARQPQPDAPAAPPPPGIPQ